MDSNKIEYQAGAGASYLELKNYRTLTEQAVRRLNIKRSSAQSCEEDEGARKGREEER